MNPAPSLPIDCPAKVNLALSIASPLPNGYHPLASWMVAVHFADRLTLAPSPDAQSHFDFAYDPAAPVPGVIDWPLEKDLGFRAHALLESHVGRPLPISATLRKFIPTGAGLGGGSSDAAAMLVGINRLLGLKLDLATLRALGQKLGSDVGFLVAALAGQPSALVTGLGESLAPAPLAEIIHLVLIFPGFGCPTGDVYKTFDRLHAGAAARQPETQRVRDLITRSPLPQDGPFNDLAAPACAVRPRLGEIQADLTTKFGLPVHITGSGATLFVVAPNALTAKALARKATAVSGLAAVATRTLGGK
ncbi:MAG: hypothetical protein NTW19_08915 [Planctomycetota bacterium]|nr:hypothetical protein [Planctomycetota bacterium]